MADLKLVPIPLRTPNSHVTGKPPVSWHLTDKTPPSARQNLPTTDDRVASLYQWGPLQFQVWPLNVHEVDHETGSEWAHKLVVGAPIYREYTGEADDVIFFRGRIFPYRIGGMSSLELFEATRRSGMANLLVRGKGEIMGWYVCEKLHRSHKELSSEGVGQMIEFEAHMARIPSPADGVSYLSQLWGIGYIAQE